MELNGEPNNKSTSESNGKKVLCIEDEYFISELYVRALTKAGYSITVEPDGQQGLALAATDQFDIILLDLMIPSMTGFEVLKALRDPAKTPYLHAKIIITTNLEQREEVRADIEQQADGYIVKAEVTPRELVEFLSNIDI
jgi:CheY-like chemotaxis protein